MEGGDLKMLPDKIYRILKWLCLIGLPALGTLWFTLSSIWGWPYGEAVLGTISAVATFIGVCIGVSTIQYNAKNKGDDNVE